jgi:glutamine synthetase
MKYEYIWLDGYTPEPNLRSKTKVIDDENESDPPVWFFDGSSTKQAEGNYSDCALKPVRQYNDPFREDGKLVFCEVLDADMKPHVSNTRHLVTEPEGSEYWFGFEQEYILIDPNTQSPLGFPIMGYPAPQGPYYCAVGYKNVHGRDIVEEHLDACLAAGIEITGINAEVMLGQWEFQVLCRGLANCDDLWVARYLLYRIAEKHGVNISFQPKPVKGDWNGSGMHTNFSNSLMRNRGGKEMFDNILSNLESCHKEALTNYGSENNERLTGEHETAHMDEFRAGVSDRGASIRIPQSTAKDWKGYLEDRRPASNADPYRVAKILIDNTWEACQK